MRLSPEATRWFVRVRWLACAAVFFATWFTSSVLGVVRHPGPLYLVGTAMVAYNPWFYLRRRRRSAGEVNVDWNIFVQISCDLVALTLLLYFTDLPRNPFLFFLCST